MNNQTVFAPVAAMASFTACGEEPQGGGKDRAVAGGEASAEALIQSYETSGEAVLVSDDQLTIVQVPVAEIGWPEMAMEFVAETLAQLDGLVVAGVVFFASHETGAGYSLVSIERRTP